MFFSSIFQLFSLYGRRATRYVSDFLGLSKTARRSCISLLNRAFRFGWRFVRWLFRTLHWLFVPELVLKLLLRHVCAFLVLWICHRLWQAFDHRVLRHSLKYLYSIFGNKAFIKRRTELKDAMDRAMSFEEWKNAAEMLDTLEGKSSWKDDPRSPFYDYRRIQHELSFLRTLVALSHGTYINIVEKQDVTGIMRHVRISLSRNIAGIGDKRLYATLRAGTKHLIEEYLDEVVRALRIVMNAPTEAISNGQKLSFFNEIRHSFGRSALLLSGGATLGLYHNGVCKALFDANLLPRVLSGSSAGSIIAAVVGTRTDEELRHIFHSDEAFFLDAFPSHELSTVLVRLRRLFSEGHLLDPALLEHCVKSNIAPCTFAEAYERTGRILCIVVSPARGSKDQPLLLNYLTSPNVLVWSAVMASSAVPFIFPSVQLLAKDENGRISPYFPDNEVRWEDGTMKSDLPMQKLSELFNVNHFIVSQTNPHVLPFLDTPQAHVSNFAIFNQIMSFLRSEISNTLINIFNTGLINSGLIHYALDQKYIGDITILPRVGLSDYFTLFSNLTWQQTWMYTRLNEIATWEQMAIIKSHCQVEFALDEAVRSIRGLVLREEVQFLKISRHLQRIRSYSTDLFESANEPSPTASNNKYEDEDLNDSSSMELRTSSSALDLSLHDERKVRRYQESKALFLDRDIPKRVLDSDCSTSSKPDDLSTCTAIIPRSNVFSSPTLSSSSFSDPFILSDSWSSTSTSPLKKSGLSLM